jgi:hypothetical protein
VRQSDHAAGCSCKPNAEAGARAVKLTFPWADAAGMAALAHRPAVRISMLLATLAALVLGLAFHATHLSTSGPSTAPALTAAQKSTAQAALNRINPPTTFSRYTSWRLGRSSKTAVPCLAGPAICFGSRAVVTPLTLRVLGTLLADFHVRMGRALCTDMAELQTASCNGSATIPGYVLGFIVTAERPVHPGERPGTQVILFAIKRG